MRIFGMGKRMTSGVPAMLIALLMLLGVNCSKGEKMKKKVDKVTAKPPVAERIKKELTIHGHTRIDYYYWLNQREDPKVIDYLNAENKYLETMMKHTEGLQKKLYDEIVGRIKKTDMSVPYRLRGYYYYTRYEKEKEYPIYCRKKGSLGGEEEILLDVNEMAKGHKYYHVAGFSVSNNNNIIAFGVDIVSRRKYTLHFKDLKSGKILPDQIKNTTGAATWANDNKTVFYGKKDKTLRAFKIFKYALGGKSQKGTEVYHEKDVTFSTGVYKTKSEKYLMISSYSTLSDEVRYMDANTPDGEFKIMQPRQKDLKYSVGHYKDKFYIQTNLNAKNFQLMETPVDKTTKENWRVVIPHRKDVLLEGFNIFKDYLVLKERRNGLTDIRVKTWDGADDHYIDFGEQVYVSYLGFNPEFDTQLLRYGYSSLTTPVSTLEYNMRSRQKKLLKQEEVLGGFNKDDYFAERHYAAAKDGTRIPISLVYRKGLKKNGQNPLLLYGYGSYGYSMDPWFNSTRISLLDRGFVYAIAHIRGGQEMGRWWYEDGKLLKKKNTFTDFIACAEYLIAEKYTSKEKMFAHGASAGGLLMGAVLNMRPDLFKGVIAGVPWVDVVTTMLDDSIPLTTSEYDEWGNPNDKTYYDYMLSYSPYDNVKAQTYPALLVTTGLHDSQVQYFEPAKWVAKLRYLKTDDNLLLLSTDMTSGHGGASGRFRRYKRLALIYTFMLDQLGITE